MTLPTLDKTGGAAWQFIANGVSSVNMSVGGSGTMLTDNKLTMYAIKAALKGFASTPWSVSRSCGYTDKAAPPTRVWTADATDNWTDYLCVDWAAAGSNHAWIVLTQSGLGSAQVLIDCNVANANSYNCTIIFSPAGTFTGGSTTAAPTHTDGITLISAAAWGGSTAAYYTKGLHVMQSADGQCTRVILCMANVCSGLWIFEKAKNPIAAWTAPYFAGAVGSSASAEVATYTNWNDAAKCNTKYGATTVTNYMTSAFYGTATVGENITYPDDNSLEWPINSIGLASLTAAHRGGRKGEVFDLWWGSTAVQIGTTYPEDGTKQFAQFGHLIFPWNGSVPKMT